MKKYKSKVDWWLVLIMLIIFGYPFIDGILTGEYILSLVFGIILLGLFVLGKNLNYTIKDSNLIIWWIKIDVTSIRRIYATRNPLSSPALSLDRIAIVYNKYDEVLISPKDRASFINHLLEINPNIEVKL